VNAKRESRACDVGRAFGKCQVKLAKGGTPAMQWLNQPGISGDVGTELGLTPDGWTDSLSFAWTSDETPIPGAEAATYVVAAESAGH
jgi:hypothetical protein